MTIGEKLRNARKIHGLSQLQLAEKICVSRQAVTKWESDRGTPDIENLKAISSLLNISVDYLINDEEYFCSNVLKVPIFLDSYPKSKWNSLTEDYVVLEQYANAQSIYELSRKRKMTTKEKIVDFVVLPGLNDIQDHWRDPSKYYLVCQREDSFVVNITRNFLISKKLIHPMDGTSFEIEDNIFTKTRRKLK